jgi:LPS-assembly protein
MFTSRVRLAIGAFFCCFSSAAWPATNLPALKVDPRLLGLPALPGAEPTPSAPPTPAAKPAPTTSEPSPAAPPQNAAPTPSAPAAVESQPAPAAAVPAPEQVAPARPLPAPELETPRPIEAVPAQAETPPPTPATSPEPAVQLVPTAALPKLRPHSDEATPLFVKAMTIQGHQDHEIEAQGDVEVRKLGMRVNADAIRYDTPTQELHAEGDVRIQSQDIVVRGPDLDLKLDTQTGKMDKPQYVLATEHARGRADKLEFLGEDKFGLDSGTFTTCAPGQDDWFIRASKLHIDRTIQEGVARDARVEFMGVPLLYTPWISFPLNAQRKSGLLTPSFGTTGNNGTEVTLPYYWNIAPNYDATITPRYMQKRGLQVGAEFRYLQPTYSGTLLGEILPNDKITQSNRNALQIQHQQTFGHGLSGYLNVQRVSDDNYYRDLSTLVAVTSQTILPREGVLNYVNGGLSLLGRVQGFQLLQDPLAPITSPYERRPQLALGYTRLNLFSVSDLRVQGEYTDFRHDPFQNGTDFPNGRRFYAYPSISLPMIRSYGYLTPKVGVHYTRYTLDETTTTLPDSTRTLPIYSLDGGLVFEREADYFGNHLTQTLEPRIYYLYVPYQDQSQMPNFDSGEADFNFAQIFSENRFTGNDRISDANQLTFALTSRLLDPVSGEERLRGMIGQRLNLRTPRVTLTSAAPTEKRSDFLASLGATLAHGWDVDSAWDYNPNDVHTQRFNFGTRYAPEPGKVANFSYRFNRDTLRQFDTSVQWPINAQWDGIARWNYSLQDDRTLEGLIGVEYNKGCWALRVVGHRFATATQQATNALFIQLELTGVSSIGTNPLSLLRQSISGYQKPAPQLGTYNPEDF